MLGIVAHQPVVAAGHLASPLPSSRWSAKNSQFTIVGAVRCHPRKAKCRGGVVVLREKLRSPTFPMLPGPPSWAARSRKCRKERGALSCTASLGLEVTPTTVVVLSSVLGFAAVRAYVYFRLEYIIAAMLGRHVPRGGAKVVELNIRGGRNLYYYPSDIVQVVAVSSKPNKQILESQAIRAGVPIQISTRSRDSLGLPTSSMDAVVSVSCFNEIPDKEVTGVLREAARVLKPGKPFIFVETVGAQNAVIRSLQNAAEGLLSLVGSKKVTPRDLLPYFREVQDFEAVECEEVFSLLDPHVVGIAKKKLSVPRDLSQEGKKGFKRSNA